MPTIDKRQLIRLENESKRFTKEIEQKERDNILLREQIIQIKSEIVESQKIYDELAKVSHDRSSIECTVQEIVKKLIIPTRWFYCNSGRHRQ